jgi:hypothetical protein
VSLFAEREVLSEKLKKVGCGIILPGVRVTNCTLILSGWTQPSSLTVEDCALLYFVLFCCTLLTGLVNPLDDVLESIAVWYEFASHPQLERIEGTLELLHFHRI